MFGVLTVLLSPNLMRTTATLSLSNSVPSLSLSRSLKDIDHPLSSSTFRLNYTTAQSQSLSLSFSSLCNASNGSHLARRTRCCPHTKVTQMYWIGPTRSQRWLPPQSSVADPDLEIMGGGGGGGSHSDPEIRGGGGLKKRENFSPFGPHFSLKIGGPAPGPLPWIRHWSCKNSSTQE